MKIHLYSGCFTKPLYPQIQCSTQPPFLRDCCSLCSSNQWLLLLSSQTRTSKLYRMMPPLCHLTYSRSHHVPLTLCPKYPSILPLLSTPALVLAAINTSVTTQYHFHSCFPPVHSPPCPQSETSKMQILSCYFHVTFLLKFLH